MEEREILEKLVEAKRSGDTRKVEVLTELYKRGSAGVSTLSPAQLELQGKGGAAGVPGGVGPDGKSYYDSPENRAAAQQEEPFFQRPGVQRFMQNAEAGAMAVPALAVGVRGLQLLSRGSKASPYVTQLGKFTVPTTGTQLAKEGVIGAVAGGTAGVGGDVFAERQGEEYRPVGELFGGILGGMGGNFLVNTVPKSISGATSLFGKVKEQLMGSELSGAIGTNAARTKIEQAMASNPNFVKDLEGAAQIQERLGINLPMSAAAKDDPSIKSMTAQVTSRGENTAFIAEMVNAENTAKQQLKAARDRLATNPKDAASIAEYNAAKDNARLAEERLIVAKKQAKREQVISNIDDRISELSDGIVKAGQDKTNVGDAIKSLVAAREAAVRAEFTPLYKQNVEEGMVAGVEMPSENVSNILGLINRYGEKNIFQAAPSLAKAIEKELGVKAATKAETVGKGKISSRLAKPAEDAIPRTLNAEQADSLKRAVNEALRDNRNPTHEPFLKELKKAVSDGLDNMGEFGAKLKETDKQYRIKVGEPFLDDNGVVAVNDAKFVERTIPMLTTPSALRGIKAAVGDDPGFNKIVRDAWMWKLGSSPSIVKEGGVDTVRLNRFLRENKSAIEQIPGLEAELRAVGSRTDALQAARARILDRQRKAGLDAFDAEARKNPTLWQEINNTPGGLVGYVDKALKTPADMSKLIQQANISQEAHSSLRSAALEAAMTKPDKLKYLDDHKEAFDSLFGQGYVKDVRLLLDAAQRLQSYPFFYKPSPSLTAGTGFQQATGMPLTQASSTLRNPISNAFTKASIFMSKFVQNKAQQTEQDELMNFLRNRKAVGDAAQAMKAAEEELKKTGNMVKAAARFSAGIAKNNATSMFYGGIAGYGLGQADMLEEAPPRQYTDPEADMEIE